MKSKIIYEIDRTVIELDGSVWAQFEYNRVFDIYGDVNRRYLGDFWRECRKKIILLPNDRHQCDFWEKLETAIPIITLSDLQIKENINGKLYKFTKTGTGSGMAKAVGG